MPWFDLDAETLKTYRTGAIEPDDLDTFWREMKESADLAASPIQLIPYKKNIYNTAIEVYDVTFSGAHGDPICAWYIKPIKAASPLPLIVSFPGYGGGRGLPIDHLSYTALGFAVFVMDIRGQGGSWTIGHTGDQDHGGHSPTYPGIMTKGIHDHRKYYFTRLYIDAVRAVEEAAKLEGIDRNRIFPSGASQGGALSLVVSALLPDIVKACIAEIPFLADFPRAIGISSYPYKEIADFLAQHSDLIEQSLHTLRYVDTALLARRITAPCLLSLGMMDDIAPPSSVYAIYNEIRGSKILETYPFTGHQVPSIQQEKRIEFLKQYI